MSIQPAWQQRLDCFGPPIVVGPSRAALTSDAGLLPLRQFDEHIGLTRAFAAALDDPRDPALTEHTFPEMARGRGYGILAAYEDQNDHDTLRHDPAFKLVAGRPPDGDDLASQPTLSRFENAIRIAALKRLRDLFIDPFIAAFPRPPRRLTLDLDAVDDPAHGHRQLTFWHGFYDQNQYRPLVITCADNDQLVLLSWRPGNVRAAPGADDDLAHLVRRLRQVRPDVELLIRGDAGFGVPWVYDACEPRDLRYTFGLAANQVLQRRSEPLPAEAVRRFAKAGVPQRLFDGFWYQAKGWPFPRRVIVKAEANARGTNRRFGVSNRPGARLLWEAAYDDDAGRGESEDRDKEFQGGLAMDRLSDHRFVANYFRLSLHAAALNLLTRRRRQVAEPPAPAAAVPPEALAGTERRRHFRRRRQRDPPGEGQPCTWRLLLIKVAAAVIGSTRRVVVRRSGSWPHRDHFRHVRARLAGAAARAAPSG